MQLRIAFLRGNELKKRVPWENELVKEKRSELKKAYMKNKRLPNSNIANHLKQAKEEL